MAKKSVKKGKKVSFHELTNDELDQRFNDAKRQLQDIRFKLVTSAVQDVRRIRNLKREVARVLTIKRLREIEAGKQAEA